MQGIGAGAGVVQEFRCPLQPPPLPPLRGLQVRLDWALTGTLMLPLTLRRAIWVTIIEQGKLYPL